MTHQPALSFSVSFKIPSIAPVGAHQTFAKKMRFRFPASFVVTAFLTAAVADEARDKILAELNELAPPKLEPIDQTVAATLKIPDEPAIVGQPFELTLTATNKGKVKVAVPINRCLRDEWVWDGIGIRCSPDTAFQRTSIFTNPPSIGYILPGETKTFRLTWTPLEHNMGNGELSLELPPEFQIVAPVKVTVNTQGRKITPEAQGEQDGTGQPATRPESKPEDSDKPQPEAEGRSR